MRRTHLLLALCLGACSPYEYAKEVGGFSTSVDQLAAAVAEGYAKLAADQASATRQRLIDRRAVVNLARSCEMPLGGSALSQQPCGFYGFGEKEPAWPELRESQTQVNRTVKGITAYAQGLQAVTNAADRKAYDEAAKRLEGGLAKLATAANSAFPGAGVIAPAATNLVLWVVGAALDNDRFDTLKAAANTASIYLPTVATFLASALDELNHARRDVLIGEIDDLVKPLGPRLSTAVYQVRFDQAEPKRATLDALRRASVRQAKEDLLKAHEELKDAVNDPRRNIAPLMSAIADFAAAAKKVHDAMSRS